ncbi:MAG: RNA methyltransferase, TrmA family [uncultured Acidimicrobiales bacterium]|uniref:RNA methyltransferase, TrmA family n=1 Tax=uncultured Acidimicrobiales bacterium TaxID=310071 RepID=A0A6J4IWI9_9ACTN|nr:MAG: RNA methyltransferase, TrmA family [uncultured Acidimicrobiales bacterium]
MTVVELETTGVAAGGEAVARDGTGRVVFVAGALPGERVTAALTEERSSFAKARVVDVLEPAEGRVTPPCPQVARGCGGCGWQHIEPGTQRSLKASIVGDALRRQGGVPEPVVDPGPALPVSGFRTTLRLAVAGSGGAGYRRARSHQVVDVDECVIAHPLLRQMVTDATFAGATEVTLRCGARSGDRLALVDPTSARTVLPEGHDDVLVVGTDELRAGRRAWIHESLAGRRWRISARSFFQARPDGAEALVDAVGEALGPPRAAGERLLDAYGGVGLFGGCLGAGRRTTLLERSASSVADARHNLADLDARVLRLDVERWRPAPMDVVVADPARTGLGRAAVGVLAATRARRIVLVSCDPASLGRDAALLRGAGYHWTSTRLVDLFPHTPHVEAVSSFDRRASTGVDGNEEDGHGRGR